MTHHKPLKTCVPSLGPSEQLQPLTLESAKTYSFRWIFSFSVSTRITSLLRNFCDLISCRTEGRREFTHSFFIHFSNQHIQVPLHSGSRLRPPDLLGPGVSPKFMSAPEYSSQGCPCSGRVLPAVRQGWPGQSREPDQAA